MELAADAQAAESRPFQRRTVREIHGHEVTYRMSGEGPTIALIHGIVGSSTTWKGVLPALAGALHRRGSRLAGPRPFGQAAAGDYSLGAARERHTLTCSPCWARNG